MGDAINLASRMQTAAEPNTILISESTQRLIAPVAGGFVYLGHRAMTGGPWDQVLFYGAGVASGLALAVIGVRLLNREAIVMRL